MCHTAIQKLLMLPRLWNAVYYYTATFEDLLCVYKHAVVAADFTDCKVFQI